MHEVLIIANGPYNDSIVHSLAPNKTIIALDGAANNLLNITPHYILGDFDSINPSIKNKYEKLNVLFILAEDQNYTDLEKAILFSKKNGATHISICCADGGTRSDHSLATLAFLKKYYSKECEITLHTECELIQFLQNETFSFSGQIGDPCAFFGWPSAVVTTTGLLWNVNAWKTEIGLNASICNELKEPVVSLYVEGNLLLITKR
ncbi:MAG: thiamine diphosphokinase [Chlamydiales bacterium]|nr:thiamine diphosphokinase [Chlamydiales bacterium]